MSTFDELRKRTNNLVQSIADNTGVSPALVLNIIQYAKVLSPPGLTDKIDELVFVAQLGKRFGITSRFYIQIIFESLKIKTTRHVKLEDYVRMVCVFYTTRLNVKIDFVFNVYDFQRDGFIDLGEMYKLLENSLVLTNEDDPNMHVKELIDIVVAVVDENNDGKISLQEFRKYVGRDILCLELFGQVLPQKNVIDGFIQMIQDKTPKYVRDLFDQERNICLCEPKMERKREALYRVSLEIP